jgi:hypothetical protein
MDIHGRMAAENPAIVSLHPCGISLPCSDAYTLRPAPREVLQGAVATCDQGEAMEKTLLGRVLVGGLVVLGVIGVSQCARVDAAEPVRVRKNAKDLSSQEKQDLVGAYHAMKEAPSPWDAKLSYYDQFVYWHNVRKRPSRRQRKGRDDSVLGL